MSGSRKGSLKQKSERFDSNINKRGSVKLSSKKEKQFTVGPVRPTSSQLTAPLSPPLALQPQQPVVFGSLPGDQGGAEHP